MLRDTLRAVAPEFVKRWIRARREISAAPVYDLWPEGARPAPTNGSRRALCSYITRAFRLPPGNPDHIRFSNFGIARGIVGTLNELGYCVDLVDWADNTFLPVRDYELFLGHGGINFERIANSLGARTQKIYFSTGAYWKFHNDQELARLDALEQRRGAKLSPDRFIEHSEEWANKNADGIVCLGNEFLRETYQKFPVVLNLNNAAYPQPRPENPKKGFASARRNFLFFAGGGNVHKGLDLLLEAFSGLEADLWVCQLLRPDFSREYRHELEELPNIHFVGWVPMRSPRFYELAARCAYTILPSCSEGCAGSVVECLHHGLIPVVSRETGIETREFGITLDNCSIEAIAQTVEGLSKQPAEWCAEKSRATRAAAERDFSEAMFRQNLRAALENILRS